MSSRRGLLTLSMPPSSLLTTTNCSLSLNTNSPSLWLALYFFFNLSLTLYNKSVLIHFPFPYTLTAIHALCGTLGTWLLLRYQLGGWRAVLGLSKKRRREKGHTEELERWSPGPGVPRLDTKESIVLFFFSILYTINIVVSNASLRLVTVPFHQVVRAATPFFTLLFSAIILRNNFKCTTRKALSLVPVVVGVGFATYGDYYFTTLGFLLTLLGTVLAALKTIITHLILIKPSQSSSSATNAKSLQEPTLPLHSPVGYSTVPLPSPSSEKENVYYRHRSPVPSPSAPPKPSSRPGSPPPQNRIDDSLLLSASHYPPSPYSPPPSPSLLSPSASPSSHLLLSSSTNGYGSPASSNPNPNPNPTPSLQDKIPKLKLTPLHLLYLLSPLAFIQTTLLAHWTGELERVGVYLTSLNASGISSGTTTTAGVGAAADAAIAISGAGGYLTRIGEWVHLNGLGGFQLLSFSDLKNVGAHAHIHVVPGGGAAAAAAGGGGWGGVDFRVWLMLNGIMAFWLNVVSFNANRRVGALGMTVAANVKQVLTILLAVLIFDLTITPANALGVLLTIVGGAGYAFVELGEKKVRRV